MTNITVFGVSSSLENQKGSRRGLWTIARHSINVLMFLVAVAVLAVACLRVLCIFWTGASILERMLLVCSSPDTTVQQPPYFL